MNKHIKKEIDFAGRKLILETGELAVRADLAVKATYGETVVLVTVVAGDENPDLDFFPLTVNYEEKLYASGTIKTSRFVKRDGRSTDDAIIARRVIDHAIRPLFPKDYMNEVQVVATVLSLDDSADPEFLSMVATSAALHGSVIPWTGPVTTVRVGLIDGKLVLCPDLGTLEEKSDLDMVVSFVGKDKKFLAVEAGANVLPEEKILEAINFAHENVDPLLDLIEDFAKEVNPKHEKHEYTSKALSKELLSAVEEIAGKTLKRIVNQEFDDVDAKEKRFEIEEAVTSKLEGKFKKADMQRALEEVEVKMVQHLILDDDKRVDGRGIKDIRPISAKVSVLPRTHGSGLFTRGSTQALTVATLGSPSMEILIQDMYGERQKRFIHYYNFPPYSTGEVGPIGAPKSREIGHGMLAERALRPVIPSQKEFPYTIILVSEIVASNGSSSMAATCGSTLALMDAGVPIKDMVGGIAMGLIVRDETFKDFKILTDLCGEEDGGGYLDFKMAGTRSGITAIQSDMKVKGMPIKLLPEILKQSKEGRLKVLDEMEKVISKSRGEVSKYAPKMYTLQIAEDKIGVVIGSGGKTIRDIQERTDTEIHIEDDGTIVVASMDDAKAEKALEIIRGLTHDVKPGEVYDGEVVDILEFGALVEILPGKVGLLHISEIANGYVKEVRDHLKVGDKVKVKVLRAERDGKISLSKRAV